MREDVKKFLFFGIEEERESFFKRAQEQGIIHFIDPNQKGHKDIPEEVQDVISAIRILRSLPSREQEENFENIDPEAVVNAILQLQDQREKWMEVRRVTSIEISRIEVFGNFSFEDIAYIEKKGKCHIQFFCCRPGLFEAQPEPENLIYVASEHNLDYYIAVNDHHISYDRMLEMKFEHSLGELKQREINAQKEFHQIDHELKMYQKYNRYLHDLLIEKLNTVNLINAQTYIQYAMDGKLFAIEGWVPENKIRQIQEVIGELNVHGEEIAIEKADVIPTYLENEGLSRLGEDLVHIYDTPSASDKDPSMWVLGAFALFFAFIIGDAGYGLVYLLIALFFRFKYPNLKGAAKRFLDLSTVLFVGCVVWGTLMTSFFGMQIAVDNPLRKVSLVQWLAEKKAAYHLLHKDEVAEEWLKKYPELKEVKDSHEFVSYSPKSGEPPVILNKLTDNIMFELALFIGVVHLILSLVRYSLRNWHHVGWIAFLIGAYLYFPYYLKTPSLLNYVGGINLEKGGLFGFQIMIAGIGVAWVLSIIKHGWTGIFEITVLIQIFADTLSYLRLYALGLAGAIVGSTINEIASGMPLIVGILLVLISHFINIILGTMSGVIHGLRLNFLEWYHYSFEGGGKQFLPLKLIKRN